MVRLNWLNALMLDDKCTYHSNKFVVATKFASLKMFDNCIYDQRELYALNSQLCNCACENAAIKGITQSLANV